jgi:hypothetical protein
MSFRFFELREVATRGCETRRRQLNISSIRRSWRRRENKKPRTILPIEILLKCSVDGVTKQLQPHDLKMPYGTLAI